VATDPIPEQPEYVVAAMAHARYSRIRDGTFWGEIPGLPGVWANAATEDECRRELESVLRGWILIRRQRGLALPPLPHQATTA
jgi:predicted RNase H-like HicB family nuclease